MQYNVIKRHVFKLIMLSGFFMALNGAFLTPSYGQDDFLNTPSLPPVTGKAEPRSMPVKGEDGIYHHDWYKDSFLDLREDIAEAKEDGKQVVLFIEMNGCPYCKKLQQQVMSSAYIKNYVTQNFHAISININGDKSTTDLDGKEMTESKLMKRWGVRYTPTMVFLPTDLPEKTHKSGRELALIPPVLPARFTAEGVYDLFVWIRHKGYNSKTSLQDFHKARQKQRIAQKK